MKHMKGKMQPQAFCSATAKCHYFRAKSAEKSQKNRRLIEVAQTALRALDRKNQTLFVVVSVLPDEISDTAKEDEHERYHGNTSENDMIKKHKSLLRTNLVSMA
jgi:hypothetical protein